MLYDVYMTINQNYQCDLLRMAINQYPLIWWIPIYEGWEGELSIYGISHQIESDQIKLNQTLRILRLSICWISHQIESNLTRFWGFWSCRYIECHIKLNQILRMWQLISSIWWNFYLYLTESNWIRRINHWWSWFDLFRRRNPINLKGFEKYLLKTSVTKRFLRLFRDRQTRGENSFKEAEKCREIQ